MDDHYDILGVKSTATPEEIRQRFRFLAQAFHPDKYSSAQQKKLAEEEFKKINKAYQVLSNARKRADYDFQRLRPAGYSNTRDANPNRSAQETARRQREWEDQQRRHEEATRQKMKEQEEQKRKSEEARKKKSRINFPRIISVYSHLDDEGKLNIATNLSTQIASEGKRVGIVDIDVHSLGILELFDINKGLIQKTLTDYLHGKAAIHETGVSIGVKDYFGSGYGEFKHGNLVLFPLYITGREMTQLLREGLDFNRLNEGFQTAIQVFSLDFLFVLTSRDLEEETLLTLATSDELIIVMKPENQYLHGTSVVVDIARSLDIPDLFLIINKVLRKLDINKIRNEIESLYNLPVIGILPSLPEVVNIRQNGFFSLKFPDHEWSREIKNIASTILTV